MAQAFPPNTQSLWMIYFPTRGELNVKVGLESLGGPYRKITQPFFREPYYKKFITHSSTQRVVFSEDNALKQVNPRINPPVSGRGESFLNIGVQWIEMQSIALCSAGAVVTEKEPAPTAPAPVEPTPSAWCLGKTRSQGPGNLHPHPKLLSGVQSAHHRFEDSGFVILSRGINRTV